MQLVQPTTITLAERVSRACGREVWVKHDNATHPRYGGNKVRKLEHLLDEARREGATHLLTAGAAGSHHVLATVVHGAAAGFKVEAVLTPRPRTPHAMATLRATGIAIVAEPNGASIGSATDVPAGKVTAPSTMQPGP